MFQCPRCLADGITVERTGKMVVMDAEWAALPVEGNQMKAECNHCGLSIPGISLSIEFLETLETDNGNAHAAFEGVLKGAYATLASEGHGSADE